MRPKDIEIPSGRFTLVPAGCLHYPLGDVELISAFVERVRSLKDAHVLLMGDSTDFARGGYRSFLKTYQKDDTSTGPVEGYAQTVVEQLADKLRPIASRVDGIIIGNHFWTFKDGTNSEQRLAAALGVDYLGPTVLMRYRLGRGRKEMTVTVFGVHSFGRSTTPTGAVTALLRQERITDADVILSSHSHDRLVVPLESLQISGSGQPHLGARTRLLIKTGAFLKTYKEESSVPTDEPHMVGYGEGLYRPSSLGWVELEVTTKRSTSGVAMPCYRWSGRS